MDILPGNIYWLLSMDSFQSINQVSHSSKIMPRYILLRDIPTEVYRTKANTLSVKEVWMVSDVCGKIKGMKID